jgi:hypothetical protein
MLSNAFTSPGVAVQRMHFGAVDRLCIKGRLWLTQTLLRKHVAGKLPPSIRFKIKRTGLSLSFSVDVSKSLLAAIEEII